MGSREKRELEKRKRRLARKQSPQRRGGRKVKPPPADFGPSIRFQLKAENMAPPGISGDFHTVQVTKGEPEGSGMARLEDREEREFDLYCVLFRDSGFSRNPECHDRSCAGNLIFYGSADCGPVCVEGPTGTFEFTLNAQREFSGVRQRCRARSGQEARTAFLKGIAPSLDHLSYLANTPLIIGHTLCVDQKNGTTMFGYTAPYASVVVNAGRTEFPSELIPIFGLYREPRTLRARSIVFSVTTRSWRGSTTGSVPRYSRLLEPRTSSCRPQRRSFRVIPKWSDSMPI
jgi:hypothetical protein